MKQTIPQLSSRLPQYDATKRRLQLSRMLAPPLLIVQGVMIVVMTSIVITRQQLTIVAVSAYVVLLTGAILSSLSWLLLQRALSIETSIGASNVFIIGNTLGFLGFLYAWITIHGIDTLGIVLLATPSFIIIMVGIITERVRLVVVAGVSMNAATLIVILINTPKSGTSPLVVTLLPGILACVMQSVFGLLTLASMRSYTQTLDELISTRAAFDRAREIDELKDAFITNVNHELRSPVMALQGYIELIHLVGDSIPAERRSELVASANQAGKDLIALLQNILDLRKLEQGTDDFAFESVDLRTAIEAATRLLDPHEFSAIPREIHLHIPPHLAVWGETERLCQVIANLLSNATKYSRPGTPIDISATIIPGTASDSRPRKSMPIEPPMIEVAIRDYGHGIPPQMISQLFVRFRRLPRDMASTISGNGLGLFICRVLMEAMHGTIHIESEGISGRGTTVFLRLHPAPDTRL